MAKSCLIPTPEIEELAKRFNNESLNSVNNLVGLWQERTNFDQYPTYEQLRDFKDLVRKENLERVENALSRHPVNPTNYKPSPLSSIYDDKKRKQRVSLIAQMFSDEIDSALPGMKAEDPSITRFDVINKLTPEGILSSIKDVFEVGSDVSAWDGQENAEYLAQEYKKVFDNFDWFKPEVAQIIAITENAMMYPNQMSSNEIDLSEMDLEGNSDQDASDQYTREEEYKDHWMEQAKFINPFTSLSFEVRNILRQIIDIDINGNELADDIGNPIYVSPERAHAILIKELSNMTTSDHLIPMLENLSKKHKWIENLIFLLNQDIGLKSKFYVDFRKDFHEMRTMVRVDNPDGTYSWKIVTLNKSNDPQELIKDWQLDIEDRNILDNHAVYNNKGEISKNRAYAGRVLVDDLKSQLHNMTNEQKLEIQNNKKFFPKLISALNRIGISSNPGEIKSAINNFEESEGLTISMPIDNILNSLTIVYQGLEKDNSIDAKDLISTYRTQYNNIAKLIQLSKEDDIVSGAREGGKTRYSFGIPSYFGKMIKELKGIHGEERFKQYIQKEFKQYDWFYKDGQWLNPWIEDIVNDKTVRDKLDYHELIIANATKGKKEYVDWSPLDKMIVFINEYFIDGVNTSSNKPFAYYALPIMSDSQTAEFVHFKRYTNDTGGVDIEGNKKSYQEQILDKQELLIMQEIDRMTLVEQRENSSALPINNYDITRTKDGAIRSLGGAIFKFIPTFNSLKDDYFLNNGKLFMDNFMELKNNHDPRLKQFIRESLRKANEDRFNDELIHWRNIGLFERNELDDYVYLDFKTKNEGQVIELLREFSWNNAFARSQIIQLTTTDLAFYKEGIDDFQKRYKQIEGKTLKPNTSSTYGKKQQRTVYLKDQDDFVSSALDDISKVLERKVERGLLTSVEKNAILNKFGASVKNGKKGVNVTDAQAYMSIDSYRSFMDMFGRWTPEQQTAYDNFKNNTWSFTDFNTLFQPIKPFVYTQTSVKSGVEGFSDIKVPVQNKNAVFLLLAAHDLIANSESKSEKLKALNQWMIDKDVDVIQFESAVKVGAQGMININSVDSYNDVYNELENSRLYNGVENTDVVHILDYEDIGIQVELPQHTIDSQILFGTQLRALIMSDLPSDATFNIDGNEMTKDEVVYLYNRLLVENIVVSAENVNEIFDNPIRLNEEIQNELRGNPRYETDLLDAVQLKADGKPVLPYYEAANSLRTQSLTGSIEKNRIIRQKIKGGAYVQVSNYGLVDELHINFIGNDESLGVESWDVYMPYWTKKFLPPNIFKGETHELDVGMIPPDLRMAIGFRIPTENKYSIPPLYIKGFLPSSSGDTIMLPADVTTVLGSDFD